MSAPPRFRPAALAIVLVATGCGSQSLLPTHDSISRGQDVPAGLVDGVLLLRGDCVYLQSEAAQMVIIWPAGYTLLGNQILEGGNPIAQMGQPLVVFGGSFDPEHYRRVRSIIGGSAIAPECETEIYWLATGVGPPQDG
jgi:hypothetical protein